MENKRDGRVAWLAFATGVVVLGLIGYFVVVPLFASWMLQNAFRNVPPPQPTVLTAVEMTDGPLAGQVRELDLNMPLAAWAVRDEKSPTMVHFYRVEGNKGYYSRSVPLESSEPADSTEGQLDK